MCQQTKPEGTPQDNKTNKSKAKTKTPEQEPPGAKKKKGTPNN